MLSVFEVFLWSSLIAGGVLCLLGALSIWWWDQPGSTLFGSYVGLWGAMPILGAVINVTTGASGISGILWVLTVAPWFLFVLQYTGRGFTIRSWLVLLVPVLGLIPWYWSVSVGGGVPAFEVLGIFVFVYYAAVGIVGSLLVLQAANRYGHLSLSQGVWLALAGAIPPVTMNAFGILSEQFGGPVLFGVYAAGLAGSCVVVALALFHDDVFDSTPAAGTVGERAVIRETDDLVFITDADGDLVLHNETAEARLPKLTGEMAGEPIAAVLGVGVTELAASETVLDSDGETTMINLGALLEGVADDSTERWPGATVTVREAANQYIEGDRRALEFVLSNLVENAVEHADTDSPTVELAAVIGSEDTQYPVTLTVVDDGPGIPDREVEILDAGQETPLKHGSGIGLWVILVAVNS